ncbi:MAG: hypothetical protein ACTSYZ_01245 [Candidatus Helarchaeota archaeon]
MYEIKKEKLGFKEKLLGSLGKRYMWMKGKKANKLLVQLGFLYSVYELAKLTGDYEKALDIMKQVGFEAGNDLIYESIELAKPILSRSIEDLKVILNSSWYAFLGKEKIDYFEYFPPDENGIEKVIWRCNKCMLCSGIQDDIFLKDDFDKIEGSFSSILIGIFEAFFGIVLEYAGKSYDIKMTETKCIAKGDPYQEITVIFTPKPKDEE